LKVTVEVIVKVRVKDDVSVDVDLRVLERELVTFLPVIGVDVSLKMRFMAPKQEIS
jgi:hypothetical protein